MNDNLLIANTTQIPNVILDEWMTHLSGSEFKVVMYVARRTYGFGKVGDDISIDQIAEGIKKADGSRLDKGTGLSRASVIRAVASLKNKKVLKKGRNSDGRRGDTANTYALNLNRRQKRADDPGSQNDTPPGSQNETGRVSKLDPQNPVRQNPGTSSRDADASHGDEEGKTNWFAVLCNRFDQVELPTSDEDRKRLPGNLLRCYTKEGATEGEMYRLIGHLVQRRLAGYVLSPQAALQDIRGIPKEERGKSAAAVSVGPVGRRDLAAEMRAEAMSEQEQRA